MEISDRSVREPLENERNQVNSGDRLRFVINNSYLEYYMPYTLMIKRGIISAIIVLFAIGCSDEQILESSPSGRRDYTWEADTIASEGGRQTIMHEIAGVTPSDVYIGGLSDNGHYWWHYNGDEWKPFQLTEVLNIPRSCRPERIFEIDNGHFLVAGVYTRPNARDLLLSYRNGIWKWHDLHGPEELYSVCGTKHGEIWAAGMNGYVVHISDAGWEIERVSTPGDIRNQRIFNVSDIRIGPRGEINLMTYVYYNSGVTTYYMFQRQNHNWKLIDSSDTSRDWGGRLWSGPDNNTYILGKTIWMLDGEKSVEYFRLPDNSSTRAIASRSVNDVIVATAVGNVYHYNGSNWAMLEQASSYNIIAYSIKMFATDVFILGQIIDSGIAKSVVLRGKLQSKE